MTVINVEQTPSSLALHSDFLKSDEMTMIFEDCSGGNRRYRWEERECQQREQFRSCPNHSGRRGRRKSGSREKEIDLDQRVNKHFLERAGEEIFQALWAIWSLLSLLSSAAIAWKQPQLTPKLQACSCTSKTVFTKPDMGQFGPLAIVCQLLI